MARSLGSRRHNIRLAENQSDIEKQCWFFVVERLVCFGRADAGESHVTPARECCLRCRLPVHT